MANHTKDNFSLYALAMQRHLSHGDLVGLEIKESWEETVLMAEKSVHYFLPNFPSQCCYSLEEQQQTLLHMLSASVLNDKVTSLQSVPLQAHEAGPLIFLFCK